MLLQYHWHRIVNHGTELNVMKSWPQCETDSSWSQRDIASQPSTRVRVYISHYSYWQSRTQTIQKLNRFPQESKAIFTICRPLVGNMWKPKLCIHINWKPRRLSRENGETIYHTYDTYWTRRFQILVIYYACSG